MHAHRFVLACLVFSIWLVGCESSVGGECGGGFLYNGETCVPVLQCGAGTTQVGDECVAVIPEGGAPDAGDGSVTPPPDAALPQPSFTCGEGTSYNDAGLCVPSHRVGELTLVNAIDGFAENVCGKFRSCCGDTDAGTSHELTSLSCEPELFADVWDGSQDILEAIAADPPRAAWDMEGLERLAEAFGFAGCQVTYEDFITVFGGIGDDDLVVGLVTAGGECEEDWECADGLFCTPADAPDGGAAKHCRAPVAAGGSCDNTDDCLPEAYCDPVMDVCMARSGLGEMCTSNSRCEEGLSCFDDGTCQTAGSTMHDCNDNDDCGELAYCDFGTDQCVPRLEEGQPCSSSLRCISSLACPFSEDMPVCQSSLNVCSLLF